MTLFINGVLCLTEEEIKKALSDPADSPDPLQEAIDRAFAKWAEDLSQKELNS